jgi:hypothetical protein
MDLTEPPFRVTTLKDSRIISGGASIMSFRSEVARSTVRYATSWYSTARLKTSAEAVPASTSEITTVHNALFIGYAPFHANEISR